MSLYALPGFFPPLESTKTRVAVGCQGPEGSSSHADSHQRDATSSGALHLLRKSSSSSEDESLEFDLDRLDATVVIQEARLDPARLIQSLTKKDVSNGKNGTTSGKLSDRRRPRTALLLPSDMNLTPQEEAMEFVVQVEYGGRSYTATRRLENFLWLRLGLLQEQHLDSEAIRDVPRLRQDDFVVGVVGNDGGGGGGGGCVTGGTGRGFAFLQALLRSYVPLLEEWLRSLLRTSSCPDASASWWHFFQGDDDLEGIVDPVVLSPSQSSSSFRPLDSIEESEQEW